jgi:rubrerythrin
MISTRGGEMNCKKLITYTLVVFFSFSLGLKQTVAGENKITNYSETISVLQELYGAEIIASKTYSGFAKKAEEEKYYSVSRLFIALSGSETVHAKNFKNILNDLGVEPKKITDPDIKIADTKTNLKWALKVELSEIDTNYPRLIKKLKPEGNKRALEDISYAWKSEMQHRELIKKMKSALGFFFGKIVDKLKEAKDYHVCQRCGSTVFKLPKESCMICRSPVSMYKLIK